MNEDITKVLQDLIDSFNRGEKPAVILSVVVDTEQGPSTMFMLRNAPIPHMIETHDAICDLLSEAENGLQPTQQKAH
ncbi:MAG TPA: hypothetical protein VFM46_12520 [Pseudomonadales bacterium]|nr:hypothetical protein [Pseudomonadales bacterium]